MRAEQVKKAMQTLSLTFGATTYAASALASYVRYEGSGRTKIDYVAREMGLTEKQVADGIENFAIHHPVILTEAVDLAMFDAPSVRDWVRQHAAAQEQ